MTNSSAGNQTVSDTGNEDKQRNREIAQNEAERQVVGDVRVSTWAIGIAVIIGLVVFAIAWAWFHR